jgi:hypothetical protein
MITDLPQKGPLSNPMDIGKQGPYSQLGGEFVLGPGKFQYLVLGRCRN